MRQNQRKRRHECDDQKSDQHHDEIRNHRTRRALDIAAHDCAADVKADACERHEAADSHGNDEHQGVVEFAQSELACDRQKQRRQAR